MNGLFLRRLMGNNEYRFRLKKDLDRVCAWDIGMPPLYEAGSFEPPDPATLPFVNLKLPSSFISSTDDCERWARPSVSAVSSPKSSCKP